MMAKPPGHAPRLTGTRQATSPPQYYMLGRIASGGMGSVYLAIPEDGEGASLVAIKIIHQHLAENRIFIHMLLDEANLARRITHPNVVGITDVGEYEGRHFVVMPYIEGGTMSELARKYQGKLPIGFVVRVLIDALNGLHAAHTMLDERGKPLRLVHRDVSPGNILVGTDGVARLIDFGVAKAASRMTHTAPGIVKGKFSYMAPEQALGEKIDHRADVFSAGVVLWTMLTGKRLFTGDNSAHTIRNLMSAVVPPPSQVRPQVPKCFDEVCLRALERNPGKRFQSAAEMAETLYTAGLIAQTLAPPEQVGQEVQETFAARIARRREAIEQQRSSDSMSFQLDVGDLDPETFELGTPLSSSAQAKAPPMEPEALPDARASRGAQQGAAQTASRRWLRMALWTGLSLAVTLAALLGLDHYTGLSGRLDLSERVPPWVRFWEAPGASQPRAPAPVQGSAQELDRAMAMEPPDAQPADSAPPERVIIEEPVVIQIPGDETTAATAMDAGVIDAGAPDAGAEQEARSAQRRAQVEREQRRSQRSRKAKRRAKRRARQRAERKEREQRRKRGDTSRQDGRLPDVDLEPPPFLEDE